MGINQVSSVTALQQQLNDVQKQGHGGGHRSGGEKFAEIAQAAAGMKQPAAAQTARARETPKGKDASRKENRSHDRENEDDAAEGQQPPPRNSRNVDVSV